MTAGLKYLVMWFCVTITAICINAGPSQSFGSTGKFTGWWELGGYYGTDNSSRGEIVLFTPLAQSATTIFFLDARGKLFEDDVQEGNIALGYRKMLPSGWNLGVWGGWDIRDTTNDNTFNQVSFGVEALSERYDVRVNGYVPLEDSETVSSTATDFTAVLQGNSIFVQQTNTLIQELALYGVDAEFGILLFGGNRGGNGSLKDGAAAPARRHELRAYAGGFYFDNDDADDAVAGPKGRLEYRINDVISALPGSRLTIESELSYDDVRDTKFEIGARLRIPFGSRGSDAGLRTAALTGQELRMIEGLERDTDIVTNEQSETTTTTEGAIDDATDVELNSVSFAKTANQLASAVDKGGNRLIIVQGNGADIDVSATEGQQLQENQTVQGGGSTILIRGKKSGKVVPFTAPGKRPTLSTDDANNATGAITLNSNTHVAGLNIRGNGDKNTFVFGNHGVVGGKDLDNVVIEQMDIRQMGDDGIFIEDRNSNIRIYHTQISDLGDDGITFDFENTGIKIHDVEITDVDGRGIGFRDVNENITIEDVTIRKTGAAGINFDAGNSNVIIKQTIITDVDGDGMFFFDNNTDITIKDVKIDGAGSGINGVRFSDGNTNVTIQNADIRDFQNDGISLSSANTGVTIADTLIKDIGSFGVDLGGDGDVEIRDTEIRDVAVGDGIRQAGNNGTLTITNVEIGDTGSDGIEIGGTNQTVTMNNTTFSGDYADDVIDINGLANVHALAGDNNVFSGSFGDQFCESNVQNGSFGFPGGPSNCPP